MDCEGIPDREYRDLTGAVLGERRPSSGVLEVTHRCNNRCIHCYVEPGRDDLIADPPGDVLIDVMDALVAEETLWLTFTGGEALLRPDFVELYMAAKRRGFLVSVFTNARGITEEIARLFRQYPPRLVSISLYGATAETYDAVAGVPGAFDEAMAGIRRVHEYGIPAHLKTVLMKSNVHEFEQMLAIAEGYGWFYAIDGCMTPTRVEGCGVLRERLTPEEIVAVEQRYPRARESWMRGIATRPANPRKGYHYVCRVGNSQVVIGADLRVRLCMSADEPSWPLDLGDLRGSIRHIFYEEFARELERKLPEDSRCAQCEMTSLCPTCAPWREKEGGAADIPCTFGCRLSELRLASFGPQGGPT